MRSVGFEHDGHPR